MRCRKANGQWGIGVLISTLCPSEVLTLTQPQVAPDADPATVLLAYVYLYDQRGGGVETSFKGDKQGLGSTTRNKKRFEAQQMVMLLGSLAHNVVIWARCWLTSDWILQAAPLWHAAYGARCLPCQWLSGFRCFGAAGGDCAQSGGTLGSHDS